MKYDKQYVNNDSFKEGDYVYSSFFTKKGFVESVFQDDSGEIYVVIENLGQCHISYCKKLD